MVISLWYCINLFLLILFIIELIHVQITAQGMGNAQLVARYQAKYIVSVTSIGKEKPVISLIVKLTVEVLITATVI